MQKQRKKFLFFLFFFLFFCTQSKWKKKLSRSQCAVIAPQDQLDQPVKGQGVLRWHSPGINKCCIGNLDAYLWLYLA